MAVTQTGGGTSAVAASAHARCDRFKGTDPLLVGMSRRRLAQHLGHPDATVGIPEARWMRAMTFERLVRDDAFVSPVITTSIGKLGLARPTAVRKMDCGGDIRRTSEALDLAGRAAAEGQATLLTTLAVPYLGLEGDPQATAVQPDFAIVAPARQDVDDPPPGSWLIMGDAKDYERVRARIDDRRMLKGFLQVAMGAESARAWSELPDGMVVHRCGALAVPRNSFLQPTIEIEDLTDHCAEVRARADERLQRVQATDATPLASGDLADLAKHLVATFDPSTCVTCALFVYCRNELRASEEPSAVLIETGVPAELRPALARVVDGGKVVGEVPDSILGNVQATVSGRAGWTGKRRVDPAGRPGSIDVVLAKSDAAALGVHGVAVRYRDEAGSPSEWFTSVFDNPQAPQTRSAVMAAVGRALDATLAARPEEPVHVIVPDPVTADVLVSIADSLAGLEIARLRWEHDVACGREALTFDGEPATIPPPLTDQQRLAVSFLLEDDRARAMALRTPIVDLRRVLASHVVVGGPPSDAGRLDYLVAWATATDPIDHRSLSDRIALHRHTPGARLSNEQSDVVHQANRAGRDGDKPSIETYRALVAEELQYKQQAIDDALAVLDRHVAISALWPIHHALEADAQAVWRRRLTFRASDLVRFGRTSEIWRDDNVGLLEADEACWRTLETLGNPQSARDRALDAGVRDVAFATVVGVDPIMLQVHSRRIGDESNVAVVTVGKEPVIEDSAAPKVLKGSFNVDIPWGRLEATSEEATLEWTPNREVPLDVGDTLVVVDCDAFFDGTGHGGRLKIKRPSRDTRNAPKASCSVDSYGEDPEGHRWCCRPHEEAEADTADWIAERRANGQMNPQAWPPVVDDDAFDVPAAAAPADTDVAAAAEPPADLTMDDLE
ncbi:MAG: hypothetical protein JJU45_16465 [Acidimicrobiia bacterium]|nr:hypothetical protein [Acidimicrobiia bacterium]